MMAANAESACVPIHRMVAQLPAILQQDITMCASGLGGGIVYTARVLGVDNACMKISLPRRIAGQGYLRASTPVVLNFVIGGTLYEAPADYRADEKHIREVVITGNISPTTRRRFARQPMQTKAGYVPVSNLRLSRGQFANLQWKQCRTLDLSAGGILIEMPFQPPVRAYFLLNLEISGFEGPLFVFGQVCWFSSSKRDRTQYLCGLTFIPREDLVRHFSSRALSELPALMLTFDKNKQKKLDLFMTRLPGRPKRGINDDNH